MIRNTVKRIMVIVQFASMFLGLSACGDAEQADIASSQPGTTSVSESPSPTADGTMGNIFADSDEDVPTFSGKDITFSVFRAQPEQNEWHEKMVADINKYTGVEVVWEWNDPQTYYADVEQRYQIGEVADLLYVKKTDAFLAAAEEGLFWDLGPYLDEYENFAMISETMRLGGSYNGKVYAIPNSQNVGYVLTYRLDWLNKLQLAEPENWEGFCDMLYAFTYNDPDGNGVDDTVGLYLNNNSAVWDAMESWFGVPNEWGIDENGDLIHKSRTEEYQRAYAAFRELYAEGVINNGANGVADFRQLEEQSTIYQGGFSKGLGGSTIDLMTYANMTHVELVRNNVVGENEKIYALRAYVDTGLGALCYSSDTIENVKMLAVSTKRVKTEEQLRQVLQFLNDLHSPECVTLFNHGWEGISYAVDENNNYVSVDDEFTDEEHDLKRVIDNAYSSFGGILLSELADENDKVKVPWVLGTLEETLYLPKEMNNQYSVLNYGLTLSSGTEREKGDELETKLNAAEVQYITGEIDDAGFEAALNAWWENGGAAITAEKNEKYHAAGY